MDFIAIDFETANPKRVSACAFGYARVKDGQVTDSNAHIIKPVGGHAPFQSKIHGIKAKDTQDKPDFGELFPEVQHVFEYQLVGHTMFDKQVLKALSEHFGLNLGFDYEDSCTIAKQTLPELKNHRLKNTGKTLRVPKIQTS